MLDLSRGRPAAGVAVELWAMIEPAARIARAFTNSDGRLDAPLLAGPSLHAGIYELRFHAGDYFRAVGLADADIPFLDVIPVRFGVSDADADHHVPLLLAPHGYSTYRGS